MIFRRLFVLIVTAVLALVSSNTSYAQDILLHRPTLTPITARAISDSELLECAWRQGGATPEIMKMVANDDTEWAELKSYARTDDALPEKQLDTLREGMRTHNFTVMWITANTQLDWVFGRNRGDKKPKTERKVKTLTDQRAYRFDLDDGYVVYILAKCFNLTMATRMEARVEVEDKLPEPPDAAPPAEVEPPVAKLPPTKTKEPLKLKEGKQALADRPSLEVGA